MVNKKQPNLSLDELYKLREAYRHFQSMNFIVRAINELINIREAEKKTVEMPTFDGYMPHVARELQAAFRIACDNAGINIAADCKGE